MFQDIVDELQFFPLVSNFDICGFDIYDTFVTRINRMYTGLPSLRNNLCSGKWKRCLSREAEDGEKLMFAAVTAMNLLLP
jgi:hypothetical protein